VAGRDIVLFYPGQASWEWALTTTSHPGASMFREGKDCSECHDVFGKSDAHRMGAQIVSGQMLEPTPIPGKAGSVVANVKMARDEDKFYVRVAFANPPTVGEPMSPSEVRVTMMLSDDKTKDASRGGCWAACHDNLATMPSAPEGTAITKYLVRSRSKMTRQGGDEPKPADDLKAMRADGQVLEYWQAALNKGEPAKAFEGYVLASREFKRSQIVAAEGVIDNGNTIVVLSRKLAAGERYKPLAEGQHYVLGFAIHGGYAGRRYHWVSFAKSMEIGGGPADFVVK
jgi:cytochrome c-type protein NapC